jgi:hypothetical protein
VPLGFGRQKPEDVVSLIAAKKYGRAIELLRAQLKKRGASTTLRKQLADVLVLSGKKQEAVSLLIPLADQFAREGFAAKAVSVLKKIQKIDPGRRDVDERLARLIEEKQREAVVLPVSRPGPGIGMEEIGIEPPPSGSIDIPVAPPTPPESTPPEPTPAAELPAVAPDLEIGFGAGTPISAPADDAPAPSRGPDPATSPPPTPADETPAATAPEAAPAAPPGEPDPIPVAPPDDEPPIPLAPPDEPAPIPLAPPDEPAPVPAATSEGPSPVAPTPDSPAPPSAPALTETSPDATLPLSSVPSLSEGGGGWMDVTEGSAEAPAGEEIEDYDLLYVPDGEEEEEEIDVEVDVEAEEPAESTPEEVMSDGAFADELMGLVDSVFQESSEGAFDLPEPAAPGPRRAGDQIVVSPLFRDFSVDEMVAVIQGLKLLSFERGEVILRQGQPGGSLYTLTSGRVRAFRKDPETRKQVKIADLKEGAFFGEISILTGQPRTASIVALNSCELLELDRPTLDRITQTHPHVWDVLREFAEKRSAAAK